ncbi:13277_t:CDS:1, partial [Gigaspora rosea]
SRLHTKRNIDIFFQGGEGVVTYSNGIPEIRCSAGFSAIHNETLQGYLITSARCLPGDTSEIYHTVWNSNQFRFFGVLRDFQLYSADFAVIEKLNNEYKLNPYISNSLHGEVLPSLYIDFFNFNGIQIPVGHEVCISGYDSHSKCGGVTSSNSRMNMLSLRLGVHTDEFYNMILARIDGQLSNRNVGGTVFCMDYDATNDATYILVLGI